MIPWRIVFSLGAIALAVFGFFGIRSNLRTDAFLAAVQEKDVAAVRRLLEQEPALMTTPVMPQGSRSTDGSIRWRGRTPLHYLVSDSSGEMEVAEVFLAAGADFKDRLEGDTLLHVAANSGDLPMMTWLLANGVDVNARNGCEHPVEALCSSGQFADWQTFDRQRASGTVCTGCDREGQTPLHATQRSIRAFEGSTLLLERGADVRAVDAAGRTALHVAAQESRSSQDPRVLCAYGADPSARDRNGKTPADLASESDADRYSTTGPDELAGWLRPAGGCAGIAALARPGAPVAMEDVDAAWRAYVCTRDAKWCEE